MNLEQINQQLQQFTRKRKVFLIVSIVLFALGGVASIAPYIYLLLNPEISESLDNILFAVGMIGDIMIITGVMLIILRARYLGPRVKILSELRDGKVELKVDQYGNQIIVPKGYKIEQEKLPEQTVQNCSDIDSKKQQLIDQYKNLLNQGLISEEDFEKRKDEILK